MIPYMLAARQAIESQYDATCDIIELQNTTNPTTKLEESKEVVIKEQQPCRKSYKNITSAGDGETKQTVSQVVELFIAPEVCIKPGSKIIITHKR